MTLVTDPRCPWISILTPQPIRFATIWTVTGFEFLPGAGNTIYFKCLDEHGRPMPNEYIYDVYPTLDKPDPTGSPIVQKTDANGEANFPIWNIQREDAPGPHNFMVRLTKNDHPAQYRDSWSEIVIGVGNHENRHDTYRVTMQLKSTSTQPPPPPPPPAPTELEARVAEAEKRIAAINLELFSLQTWRDAMRQVNK